MSEKAKRSFCGATVAKASSYHCFRQINYRPLIKRELGETYKIMGVPIGDAFADQ